MKATHYIYVLFAALFTLVCAGCEDRLNIEKHGSLGGPENYYQTDEEAEAAVASMLISWRDMYSNWFYVKNCLSDDAYTGGGSRGDNAMMEQLNEFTFFTDNGLISGLYSGLYAVVYKANLIIENVTGDSSVMRRAVAEAKFYRAWAYFELVTLWGNAPLVDHLLAPSEYHVSNSTPEALWAFVEQNLEEAISSGALPSKANVDDADATSRVTLETAKAYLGKAYLFQGKYSDAATVLDEVIDSKKYELYQGSFDMLGPTIVVNLCLKCNVAKTANKLGISSFNSISCWAGVQVTCHTAPRHCLKKALQWVLMDFSILLSHCMTLLLKEKAWTVIV